jgi:hypothetical protein
VGRAILPAGALSSALKRRLKGGGTVERPTQLVEKPWSSLGFHHDLVGRRPIRTAKIGCPTTPVYGNSELALEERSLTVAAQYGAARVSKRDA